VKHTHKPKNLTHLLMVTISLALTANAYADFGISANVANENGYKDLDDKASLSLGVEYRGDKFNMGKDGVSYEFIHADNYAVEALATSNNSGFEAKDGKNFTGMDKRKTSIDLGGRMIVKTGIGPVTLDATKDVHASKGYEAGIKVGGIAPHAPHWTGERTINVAATGGLRYQSKKVVDYYYGVKNTEATANRNAYKGKSAITPYLGVEAQADLTEHISLTGNLGITRQPNAIRNSPLAKDKKYQPVANVGFTYWF